MQTLKEIILEKTNGGLLYYNLIFKLYGQDVTIKNGLSNKLFNPFYKDTKPGFIINCSKKNGKWYFKDFGNSDYQGDVFVFAGLRYNLNSETHFSEILEIMDVDLKKYANDDLLKKDIQAWKAPVANKTEWKYFRLTECPYSEEGLAFFKQYSITEELLRENNVVELTGYRLFNDPDEGEKGFRKKTGTLMFAYKGNGFAKIYIPNPKKFLYVGKKPKDSTFGDLEGGLKNELILTGGEKDVLTLKALGYNAFCLSSEIAMPTKELLKNLFYEEVKVIIMYDIDATGLRESEKIASKYGLRRVVLPDELKTKGGKDISDWVKLGFDRVIIDGMLNEVLGEETDKKDENYENDASIKNEKSGDEQKKVENNINISKTFPDAIYDQLPELLKKGCKFFKTSREKDIFLLGALGALSVCFPKVYGIYGKSKVGMPLYIFIVAPPSSGKGIVKWAAKLVHPIHEAKLNDFKIQLKQYKQAYALYMKEKENGNYIDEPEKPIIKLLFIPGNISYSSIVKMLKNNNGIGLIFETEGDTLSNTLSQEWGDITEILLKAYQHEKVSLMRITFDAPIEIECPYVGVVLTGTPNQIPNLIPNADNGLFSRFAFYNFPLDPQWQDVFADGEVSGDEYFNDLGNTVLQYYNKVNESNQKIRFMLTKTQGQEFNKMHEEWQNKFSALVGEDIISTMRRIALIDFRIAMILSTLRVLESGSIPDKIICSDIDFNIAVQVASTLKEHAIEIYGRFGHEPVKKKYTLKKLRFYESLPNQFAKQNYVELAIKIDIKPVTADKYISDFISDKLIEREEHNHYIKKYTRM